MKSLFNLRSKFYCLYFTVTQPSYTHVADLHHLGDVVVILLYLPPPPHQLVGVRGVDVWPPAALVVVHALGHILVPLGVGLPGEGDIILGKPLLQLSHS